MCILTLAIVLVCSTSIPLSCFWPLVKAGIVTVAEYKPKRYVDLQGNLDDFGQVAINQRGAEVINKHPNDVWLCFGRVMVNGFFVKWMQETVLLICHICTLMVM